MTAHRTQSVEVRDIARWWPLILLPAVIAVAAAIWSVNHQTPTYTASTRLVVIPLAQWDETFLGTSLIRDAGDPKSTASTVAALLDTPRDVEVVVVPDSNVVEVQARSADPRQAEKMSEEFAKAVIADRWRTISAELDARIGALTVTTAADPNTGEASARLQTLTVIRQSGVDPTLRVEAAEPAVADDQLPVAMVIGLAAGGGLFVGVLCAIAVARLRRRAPTEPTAEPTAAARVTSDEPVPVYSPNGDG